MITGCWEHDGVTAGCWERSGGGVVAGCCEGGNDSSLPCEPMTSSR